MTQTDAPFHAQLSLLPHRRYNPLLGEWVLVAPHRTQRPWEGSEEDLTTVELPAHDPDCYLCPGNPRAGGVTNPPYTDTFVFTNDFPALIPDVAYQATESGLLRAETEPGTCLVVCFSPRHDLTMANLPVGTIEHVIDVWAEQTEKLGRDYRWVQVFENKGAAMGASNPHPHGQIWASHAVPDIPSREDESQRSYYRSHRSSLLGDYLEQELSDGSRIVFAGDHFVALVPFWAVWPFETMIVARRDAAHLPDLSTEERRNLAVVVSGLLGAYDRVFNYPFPYSMGWHGAPLDTADRSGWRFHGHVLPPLLRSATVRKFMVGYELLAGAQRDITAEEAADRLRTLLEVAA